jgi:hypothetical protein
VTFGGVPPLLALRVISLIIGLQVRALPGAKQVLEPIYRRFKASKIGPKKALLAKVLPLLWSTPSTFCFNWLPPL